MALGAAHKDALSLSAPTAGSARAMERVGSPRGQLPAQPAALGGFSIAASLLFLPTGGRHICLCRSPACLGCRDAQLRDTAEGWVTQLSPQRPGATCPPAPPPVATGICCTPVPGAALSGMRL